MTEYSCTMCGACCVAPDIGALGKSMGTPCVHLAPDCSCRIYAQRPAICARYAADALCVRISAPTLAGRVGAYLAEFGFSAEAARRKLPMFRPS